MDTKDTVETTMPGGASVKPALKRELCVPEEHPQERAAGELVHERGLLLTKNQARLGCRTMYFAPRFPGR